MQFGVAAPSLCSGAGGPRLLTQPVDEEMQAASSTQRLLATEGRRHASPWRHLLEIATDELRWDDRHRLIDAHPFFRGCSRQEIRRIARMGDFIEIDPGQILWRKWQIGYWFLVVFSGAVELSDEDAVDRVEAGGTVGAESILSFGPQHATARTLDTVVAFVVGRRHLLSLADNPVLRPRLGLPVEANAYVRDLRRMRAVGTSDWRHLPESGRTLIKPEHFPATFRIYERHGSAMALLTPPSTAEPSSREAVVAPLSRRLVAGIVAALLAVLAAVLSLYRPPVAVVRPGEAIDVLADIDVSGAPTYPVTGRYLLLSVRFDRPALGELLVAKARGERTVSLVSDDTSGVSAYRNSRKAAVANAVEGAGLDLDELDDLDVTIRDRELSGPSAGLVYALALRDLLDPEDHTAGRTVAVTGGVSAEGTVFPVWFVREKSGVVRRSGADVFVVPAGQEPAARPSAAEVIGARTVGEAEFALLRSR